MKYNNTVNSNKSGFAETLLVLALGAVGVFTWQHDDSIRSLKRENNDRKSEIVELRGAVNDTRTVVNRHEKALQTLGPKCDWMEALK